MKPCYHPLLILVLSAWLPSQTTWIVPNLADLAPYIAQASPGDTLLLGARHPGFSLDKGLTLRPQSGRTMISSVSPPVGMDSSIQVPTGQLAHLVNIDFVESYWSPWWNGGHPVTAAGDATFESCSFRTRQTNDHALRANGNITLRNCTARGLVEGGGLSVDGGVCSAVDSQFFGSNGWSGTGANDQYPREGARVQAGTLIASRCTFTPGTSPSSTNGYPVGPQAGLLVVGGNAFLTDCTSYGGDYPAWTTVPPPWEGAPAIRVLAGSARHARCTLLPGLGGWGTPAGAPTSGNAVVDATMVGIGSSGSLLLGTTWTATATAGTSGQPLGFAYWSAISASTLPFVPEPVWGAPAQAILIDFSVPAAGAAVPSSVVIPNVGSLVGTQLWCQALQLNLPLIRASALVGGMVR